MPANKFQAIPIKGGLDLATAPSMVEPGKFSAVLNYETVDRAGTKRSDGFTRWDGASQLKTEQLMAFTYSGAAATLDDGAYLYRSGIIPTYPFGIVTSVTPVNGYIIFALIDELALPNVGETVRLLGIGAGTFSVTVTSIPAPVNDVLGTNQSASTNATALRNFMTTTLTTIGNGGYTDENNGPRAFNYSGAPGSNFVYDNLAGADVVGLHYFNDRGYAVVDTRIFTATGTTQQIYPGEWIGTTGEGCQAQVVTATLTSGTWGSGTASVELALPYFGSASVIGATARRQFPTLDLTALTTLPRRAADGVAGNRTWCTSLSLTTLTTSALMHETVSERQAIDRGMVVSYTVTNAGAGYTTPPIVTVAGTGTGATAFATISAAGAITGVHVRNPGRGYTAVPTVTITGGGGAAGAATAVLGTWQESGWKRIDHGMLVTFDAGSSPSGYLSKIDRDKTLTGQETTFTATDTGTGSPQAFYQGLNFEGASGFSPSQWVGSAAGLAAADTSGVQVLLASGNANNDQRTPSVGFVNFNTIANAIPENATIRGIEVSWTYDTTILSAFPATAAEINSYSMRACLFKTTQNEATGALTQTRLGTFKEQNLNRATAAETNKAVDRDAVALTYGGATDLWGYSDFTDDDLRDPNFGVALDLYINRTSASSYEYVFLIDTITLKVYYNTPSVRYYFSDGTGNVLSGDLVDYVITSGSLLNGDAEGVLQVSNVTQFLTHATSGSASHSIRDNYAIWAKSDLTGRIATADGDAVYNTLPSKSLIQAADYSRYRWLSANFYANADWESVYGVSGAGRAFEFDGTYFSTIYAIPPSEAAAAAKDKPRHIAQHQFRLALGYKHGSVLLSVEGEPRNFEGVEGGSEVGVGDRVTGMLSFPGTYLAVYCENSIHGLKENTLEKTTLVPNAGAIEYTVQAIGAIPIHTNVYGVWTLSQSDKYGDFQGDPLSAAITPWLSPRARRYRGFYTPAVAYGIVDSYVVRAKNQYRLWFADGTQLVMTLSGEARAPEFSLMKYNLMKAGVGNTYASAANLSGSWDKPRPLALCSQLDANGQEMILWYPDHNTASYAYTGFTPASIAPYVYRIDHFWWHDAGTTVYGIPAYFQTQWYNKENPFQDATLKKVRLEGLTRGLASIGLTTGIEYESPDPSVDTVEPLTFPESATPIALTYTPTTSIGSPNETGRVIAMRFDNRVEGGMKTYSDTYINLGTFPTIPEPPHYVQLILAQFLEGKEDV